MLGERIKKCRIDMNLTLKALGNRLNLAESTLSLYESGKRTPDYETLRKMAEVFDVSVDYLLGRTDEKNPGQKDPEFDVNTIEYALYGEARELDEEEKQQLLELAKLMRKRRKEMMGK